MEISESAFSTEIRPSFGSPFSSVSSQLSNMSNQQSSSVALDLKSLPHASIDSAEKSTNVALGVLVVTSFSSTVDGIHRILSQLKAPVVLHASSASQLLRTLAAIVKARQPIDIILVEYAEAQRVKGNIQALKTQAGLLTVILGATHQEAVSIGYDLGIDIISTADEEMSRLSAEGVFQVLHKYEQLRADSQMLMQSSSTSAAATSQLPPPPARTPTAPIIDPPDDMESSRNAEPQSHSVSPAELQMIPVSSTAAPLEDPLCTASQDGFLALKPSTPVDSSPLHSAKSLAPVDSSPLLHSAKSLAPVLPVSEQVKRVMVVEAEASEIQSAILHLKDSGLNDPLLLPASSQQHESGITEQTGSSIKAESEVIKQQLQTPEALARQKVEQRLKRLEEKLQQKLEASGSPSPRSPHSATSSASASLEESQSLMEQAAERLNLLKQQQRATSPHSQQAGVVGSRNSGAHVRRPSPLGRPPSKEVNTPAASPSGLRRYPFEPESSNLYELAPSASPPSPQIKMQVLLAQMEELSHKKGMTDGPAVGIRESPAPVLPFEDVIRSSLYSLGSVLKSYSPSVDGPASTASSSGSVSEGSGRGLQQQQRISRESLTAAFDSNGGRTSKVETSMGLHYKSGVAQGSASSTHLLDEAGASKGKHPATSSTYSSVLHLVDSTTSVLQAKQALQEVTAMEMSATYEKLQDIMDDDDEAQQQAASVTHLVASSAGVEGVDTDKVDRTARLPSVDKLTGSAARVDTTSGNSREVVPINRASSRLLGLESFSRLTVKDLAWDSSGDDALASALMRASSLRGETMAGPTSTLEAADIAGPASTSVAAGRMPSTSPEVMQNGMLAEVLGGEDNRMRAHLLVASCTAGCVAVVAAGSSLSVHQHLQPHGDDGGDCDEAALMIDEEGHCSGHNNVAYASSSSACFSKQHNDVAGSNQALAAAATAAVTITSHPPPSSASMRLLGLIESFSPLSVKDLAWDKSGDDALEAALKSANKSDKSGDDALEAALKSANKADALAGSSKQLEDKNTAAADNDDIMESNDSVTDNEIDIVESAYSDVTDTEKQQQKHLLPDLYVQQALELDVVLLENSSTADADDDDEDCTDSGFIKEGYCSDVEVAEVVAEIDDKSHITRELTDEGRFDDEGSELDNRQPSGLQQQQTCDDLMSLHHSPPLSSRAQVHIPDALILSISSKLCVPCNLVEAVAKELFIIAGVTEPLNITDNERKEEAVVDGRAPSSSLPEVKVGDNTEKAVALPSMYTVMQQPATATYNGHVASMVRSFDDEATQTGGSLGEGTAGGSVMGGGTGGSLGEGTAGGSVMGGGTGGSLGEGTAGGSVMGGGTGGSLGEGTAGGSVMGGPGCSSYIRVSSQDSSPRGFHHMLTTEVLSAPFAGRAGVEGVDSAGGKAAEDKGLKGSMRLVSAADGEDTSLHDDYDSPSSSSQPLYVTTVPRGHKVLLEAEGKSKGNGSINMLAEKCIIRHGIGKSYDEDEDDNDGSHQHITSCSSTSGSRRSRIIRREPSFSDMSDAYSDNNYAVGNHGDDPDLAAGGNKQLNRLGGFGALGLCSVLQSSSFSESEGQQHKVLEAEKSEEDMLINSCRSPTVVPEISVDDTQQYPTFIQQSGTSSGGNDSIYGGGGLGGDTDNDEDDEAECPTSLLDESSYDPEFQEYCKIVAMMRAEAAARSDSLPQQHGIHPPDMSDMPSAGASSAVQLARKGNYHLADSTTSAAAVTSNRHEVFVNNPSSKRHNAQKIDSHPLNIVPADFW
ncbi:hypothetical protein CEUSTIGMA_g10037.t1 [Chlamydomonas eustigma]|uniref:Uncharacterized protein n=1 Tax=Chlamydomonas eustigma TaxID=1157962 RepID=A0A250XHR0_9CHLO|nr:hypothetical protein CEUSTIGMA_g10037.t1 [Chlamydomonas eustigma]|eukprot:GAX82611.1 hypothetical protein CEUSTIGMA_g10037.t1 [Chlamydomonas eustigma]